MIVYDILSQHYYLFLTLFLFLLKIVSNSHRKVIIGFSISIFDDNVTTKTNSALHFKSLLNKKLDELCQAFQKL